jgi:hypothetical protein
MPSPRNVLLIVVDQWRGDTLANLGHPCIRTPNLDALCRDGVTFRNHYAQCAPCGPARASLLTGLYQMNHRVVQNGIPLDARHVTLPQEVRRAGYDPALVGYTTTTPDPRTTHPGDPRFSHLGDTMAGWTPVAPLDPARRPYFDWLRQHGMTVPDTPSDIWLPAEGHAAGGGATTAPSRIPRELSDTTWTTEHGLAYLRGMEGRNWFLHLGYFRPHPPFIAPEPYNATYDPDEAPPPVRAASPEAEGAQHPLLAHYMGHVKQSKFFQDGEGLASAMDEAEVRRTRNRPGNTTTRLSSSPPITASSSAITICSASSAISTRPSACRWSFTTRRCRPMAGAARSSTASPNRSISCRPFWNGWAARRRAPARGIRCCRSAASMIRRAGGVRCITNSISAPITTRPPRRRPAGCRSTSAAYR